jgi:hypothetical protein
LTVESGVSVRTLIPDGSLVSNGALLSDRPLFSNQFAVFERDNMIGVPVGAFDEPFRARVGMGYAHRLAFLR